MNRAPRPFFAVLTAACALALAGPAPALADCPNADVVATAENLAVVSEALVCLHNEERAKAGATALSPDSRLAAAAQKHADDMVANLYFSHDSPTGVNPFDRLRSEGYIGPKIVWNAGETIAWASGSRATARTVMDSWLASTSQRLTLLAPDFRDIGVGISLGAPLVRLPGAAPAVTFTVDYGWRTTQRALRRCVRRANRKGQPAARRAMRAKCHGLGTRAARFR